MDSVSTEQFAADHKELMFSVSTSIDHNFMHLFYGGACNVPEEFKKIALANCIDHRQKTSQGKARTRSVAETQIKIELDKPISDLPSFSHFLRLVRKLGTSVDANAQKRLTLHICGKNANAARPKTPVEKYFNAVEKALTVHEGDAMDGTDEYAWETRRAGIRAQFAQNQRSKALVSDHPYTVRKQLQGATVALTDSSAFVCNDTLIIPFISAWSFREYVKNLDGSLAKDPDGKWIVGLREQATTEWAVDNCHSFQTISAVPDEPKKMKAGTHTTGLFHPIGGVGGANLVILCEGWATGMTIYQSLNGDVPVACVGSCNNFLTVAAAMFDSDLCSRVLIMGDA